MAFVQQVSILMTRVLKLHLGCIDWALNKFYIIIFLSALFSLFFNIIVCNKVILLIETLQDVCASDLDFIS